MNGQVKSIDLNNMNYTFKEIKKFSSASRKAYLENLAKHGCSIKDFSIYWDVSKPAAANLFNQAEVKAADGRNPWNRDRFKMYLTDPVEYSHWEEVAESNTATTASAAFIDPSKLTDTNTEEIGRDRVESKTDDLPLQAVFSSGTLNFIGTAAQVAESFYRLAPSGKLKVSISFSVIGDNEDGT